MWGTLGARHECTRVLGSGRQDVARNRRRHEGGKQLPLGHVPQTWARIPKQEEYSSLRMLPFVALLSIAVLVRSHS